MFNMDSSFVERINLELKEDEITSEQATALLLLHNVTRGPKVDFEFEVDDPENRLTFKVYAPTYYLVGVMDDGGSCSFTCTSPDRRTTYIETEHYIYSTPHSMIERVRAALTTPPKRNLASNQSSLT